MAGTAEAPMVHRLLGEAYLHDKQADKALAEFSTIADLTDRDARWQNQPTHRHESGIGQRQTV